MFRKLRSQIYRRDRNFKRHSDGKFSFEAVAKCYSHLFATRRAKAQMRETTEAIKRTTAKIVEMARAIPDHFKDACARLNQNNR